MDKQHDARESPKTKVDEGVLHPLKAVMGFIVGSDEEELAKRRDSPSQTEGRELKNVPVFEYSNHQDEAP